MLGAPIDWAAQPDTGIPLPVVMGRNFNASELSDGQKILLAWAIILHRQREHLGNAIVIIDEPENHLHPDVCIRALDRLQKDVLGDQGQIWLATHSIPLIAWAGFDAIHFVHDGRVEYAGNRVDDVVNGLVGGVEGKERLRSFLSDAENLAILKFAAECLTAPAVAYTKGNDPQEAIFAKLVADRAHAGRPLRLLDFGAGHGRLAAALAAARRAGSSGEALPPLQFLAYDRGLPCEDTCRHQLAALAAQPGVEATYVDDLRALRGAKDKVDIAVLCNVLHEVPIDKWLRTFADLHGVIAPDGCLILMEDQTPSVGELPSGNGFVILDEIETKRLFADDEGVRAVPNMVSKGWEQRLTVIEVPHPAISKATAATLGEALGDVQERAEKKIAALRDSPSAGTTFRSGRLHALYAMLWVNAMMAARTFGPAPR
jgi:SAM-dependent methyltransferase